MRSTDLTTNQLAALAGQLVPMRVYLGRLKERALAQGFDESDRKDGAP
jgi:hypothetical protein